MVTTFAGYAGIYGSLDGAGNHAKFGGFPYGGPYGVAVDGAGTLFVADKFNMTIRKVTAAGMVTTIGGLAGAADQVDGTGSAARFGAPDSIAVDRAGNLYVTDGNTIRKGVPSVTATRIIGLSGNLLYGDVTTGTTATATLTINNIGTTNLTVSSIDYPTGFSGVWSGSILAGGSQNVTVTFAPLAGTNYNGAVTVNSDAISGVNTITATGTGQTAPAVATPVIAPAGGAYTNRVGVTIKCATAGATIHYTTDGTDPTSHSTTYPKDGFTLTKSATVKAQAFKPKLTDSAIASTDFTVTTVKPQVATPTILPTGGLYQNKVKVTLKCATAGATIRYTLDGSVPTSSSTLYKATAINLTNSVLLKVKAFKTGYTDSAVATGDFSVVVPPPLTLTTTELPDGTVKVKYTATLTATGGLVPYKWSLAIGSKLPAGLTLNATTGIIAGKPTKAGSFAVIVKVTDTNKQTDTQSLPITIAN